MTARRAFRARRTAIMGVWRCHSAG
jgi:hypothetical protein